VADCPYHSKHELQIKNLEEAVKELQVNQRDPRVWVAVFSFLGVCFSTAGSLIGIVISQYFKLTGGG
jgi:hypothetical protein